VNVADIMSSIRVDSELAASDVQKTLAEAEWQAQVDLVLMELEADGIPTNYWRQRDEL